MQAVLELDRVSKRYGEVLAVDGVSFAIPGGGITGILGPNGAGKSTTLKMIVGVLGPSAGAIRLFGAAPAIGTLARVGYLPEERGLYRRMTPASAIRYFARLKGMKAGPADAAARRLLDEHGLGAWADKPVKSLSKGMAQKVQILAAVAHDPDFVLLDEPFSGLDPVNQQTLEDLVVGLAARGKTVLFSTHVMEHAERLCQRIVLIARGRVAFDGATADALAQAPRAAVVATDAGFDAAGVLAAAGFAASAEPCDPGETRLRVSLATGQDAGEVLKALVAAGAPLRLFEPTRAHLRDAFVKLVGEEASR
jgi:ABC-2 type transport system ATP-binding protein